MKQEINEKQTPEKEKWRNIIMEQKCEAYHRYGFRSNGKPNKASQNISDGQS